MKLNSQGRGKTWEIRTDYTVKGTRRRIRNGSKEVWVLKLEETMGKGNCEHGLVTLLGNCLKSEVRGRMRYTFYPNYLVQCKGEHDVARFH